MPRMGKTVLPLFATGSILFCSTMIAATCFFNAQTIFAAEQNNSAQNNSAAQQQIGELIKQLGDADYQVRSDAQKQLARLGFAAFDALSAAEYDSDPEIAARARYLLRRLQVDFFDKDDPEQVQTILHDYQSHSPEEKIETMRALAALPNGDGLGALCRLVRFQRSALLSKHAAAAVLAWQEKNREAIPQSAALVERLLAVSEQPGAQWLRESLLFAAKPDAAFARWSEFIRTENDLLSRGDARSDANLAWMLIRHELFWKFALDRNNEEKAASWRQFLSVRSKDTDTAAQIISRLLEDEAWKSLGQEPVDFAERFSGNPRAALYSLAESREKQGKTVQAAWAAEQAFRLDPDGPATRQEAERLETAAALQKQGRFPWAEREYRHCLENDGGGNEEALLVAGSYLAEMLHDQGEELRAAEALGLLIDKLKTRTDGNGKARRGLALPQDELKTMEARRLFFLAEHHKKQGEGEKQRKMLEKALATDPTEVDVLIAAYRLPDASPEFRQKVKKHIRETVDRTRLLILKNTALPTYYNQLAWLVANTEGNFDEALKFSQESLRLQPNEGGYFDTLARCYFAKGDLEKAVEAQARAHELEPHSGLIARQLEQFKKALAEKGEARGQRAEGR